MKTAIIVQARMTSTRLPGKVLRPVLDRPLLQYVVERLARCSEADATIVATTINDTDEPIVALCRELDTSVFRGSEEDVLSRYYHAAEEAGAETVVRITSDCPLIDPAVVDRVIGFFRSRFGQYDYVTNVLTRTYPRGMDCEVFSFQALARAHREATAQPDREHVTPFIYRQPERFRLGNVPFDRDASKHRWTVDTPEDFELIRKFIEALYPTRPEFTLEDCLELIAEHPEWSELNAMIEQKQYGQ